MNVVKVIFGFILIFVYHLPRLIYHGLITSYITAFHYQDTLTASPKKHLRKAKELLDKDKNSLLRYAALEIRFALEIMTDTQLQFSDFVSNNTLKKDDPAKKKMAMNSIDPDSDFDHDIYIINKETGEKTKWGIYKSLNLDRIKTIDGKLGAILHPKVGLPLGIYNDPWYINTRKFLIDSYEYLSDNLMDNNYYFIYQNNDLFELVKIDKKN